MIKYTSICLALTMTRIHNNFTYTYQVSNLRDLTTADYDLYVHICRLEVSDWSVFTNATLQVYHIKQDQFVPKNILYCDNNALFTTNGTVTENIAVDGCNKGTVKIWGKTQDLTESLGLLKFLQHQ